MSTPTSGEPGRRAGFSLMEILVVLVILALATAVIMPSTARMLDQATAHAVFFEFQRDVSAMRREANRTGEPMRLIDPDAEPDPAFDDRTIRLRDPWRYTLAPALEIGEGGVCAPTSANLVNGDAVVMTLRSDNASCRFSRQQTTAARPDAPTSP